MVRKQLQISFQDSKKKIHLTFLATKYDIKQHSDATQLRINNGNCTGCIWSEIIRVILKFEITRMISDRNCTT